MRNTAALSRRHNARRSSIALCTFEIAESDELSAQLRAVESSLYVSDVDTRAGLDDDDGRLRPMSFGNGHGLAAPEPRMEE